MSALHPPNDIVDRGIALHKVKLLIATISLIKRYGTDRQIDPLRPLF